MGSVIFEILLCLIENIIIFVFLGSLLKGRFNSAIPTVLSIVFTTISSYFCLTLPIVLKILIAVFLTLLCVLWLYQDNTVIKISYALVSMYILLITDLSSLLSNLLDNAVEAAAQTTEPFVRLTITKYNAYYTICVENSYMGKKSLKGSVGALISTKSDKAPHGYGTQIISDIAQKYDGNYSWEAQESRFISTVIMII